MTCDHAGCEQYATVRCRMGDGTFKHGNATHRQTYVRYCDPHYQTVAALFVLCNIGLEDGPNGPLPERIRARTMTRVARLSP